MLYGFPMDRKGCGWYRIGWPLAAVRSRLAVRIVWPTETTELKANFDARGNVVGVEIPDDCSAVLLQRPTADKLVEVIPFLQARGVSVLVDVDDDLLALSPRHPAAQHLSPSHPGHLAGHSARAVMQACRLADLVIASTPAILERYAAHSRGVLLRNRLRSDWRACLEAGVPGGRGGPLSAAPRVSAPYTDVKHGLPRLGWPGALVTHPDDLAVLSRTLPRLRGLHDGFTVIGPDPSSPANGDLPPDGFDQATASAMAAASRRTRTVKHHHTVDPRRLLGIPTPHTINGVTEPDGLRFTGPITFGEWFATQADRLDVAVAPLEALGPSGGAPTKFNVAKSWLKPLELAACGIPSVIADTPEYRALHDQGAHLIADGNSPKAYARHLKALLGSADLREEVRARGFEMATNNTYAAHQDEWYAALAPFTEEAALPPTPTPLHDAAAPVPV